MEVLCARIPNIRVYPIRKEFASEYLKFFCLRHVHDIQPFFRNIPLPETDIAPLKHCFFFKMSFLLGAWEGLFSGAIYFA